MKWNESSNERYRSMNRRSFLRRSIAASLAAGYLLNKPRLLLADDCVVPDMPRTLVNVMLQGGADLRFLFMPSPGHADSHYVDLTWAARQSLYASEYASYQQMFDGEYLLAQDPRSGLEFGIHNSAGWLKAQLEAGNAAIVSNAYCSRNRRHDQSILNADAGTPDLEVLNFDRSGWGGRLVEYLGGGRNSVELSTSVSTFNKGSVAGNRLQRVVHAQDMRDIALASPDAGDPASRRNILARALRAYYQARSGETAIEKPADWPYHRFFQHYSALDASGEVIQARIDACQPISDDLSNLQLNSGEFAQQCRNLFDICQAPDLLNLGVVSMNYGGWDSHDNQGLEIRANLQDVFGAGGGLATALSSIGTLPFLEKPPAEQLLFYFASDFGRQLVANGAAGTDHGRGTYSILVGSAVSGGVYGDMFPLREALPDAENRIPLETPGADIMGLTSTERITTQLSDWVQLGAGATVFPQAGASGIEEGVDLSNLVAI